MANPTAYVGASLTTLERRLAALAANPPLPGSAAADVTTDLRLAAALAAACACASTPAVVTLPVVATVDAYAADFVGGLISHLSVITTGGGAVTNAGVVWALSGTPTLSSAVVSTNAAHISVGAYSVTWNPSTHTTVHVAAFATNAAGTAYGSTLLGFPDYAT
jgi:hypothetical protein